MRLALAVAIGLLLVLAASGGMAVAVVPIDPVAAQAKPCKAESKRLSAFKRKMASRRRAFFRSHRSRKERRAFVKQQGRKLKALKRARTRCLRKPVPPVTGQPPAPAPAPAPPAQPPPAQPPPAQPPPAASDTSPPELSIDAPGAGAWFDQPLASVSGSARDGGSGIARVVCNGQAATLAGEKFTCGVPLVEGSNTLEVIATDGAGNARTGTVVVRHRPGVVAGAPGATAVGAVQNRDVGLRHEDSQTEVTPDGLRVARGEIAVRIDGAATVEQVNDALETVGGRIVGSVAGSPQLAVAIPDPGSLDALEDLLAALRTRPGVARASLADMAETNELPSGFASPLPAARALELSHLLAMRMPAAWNARGAVRLNEQPTLIVADLFGNGPLSSHVDASYNASDLISRIGSNEHGYHVVGIAASRFATNGTAAGNVTGVFPATTQLHVIEAIGLTYQMTGVRIVQEANARTGRVVVNTSLGPLVAITDLKAQDDGSDWGQLVKGSAGLEDRMLHATSAGNTSGRAATNSRWSAAAVRPDLENAFGQPMPALRNTLAVENLVDTGSPEFEPGCLGTDSNSAGTISAVGTDVYSHRFGSLAGDKTGTSMASPQVAGLAMFLWSIDPSRTAAGLRDAMVATARPPLGEDALCGTELSAPRLDAYTAVLSLDKPVALTPATAPVRLAIMDRDDDDDFDEDDLDGFSAAARPSAGDRDWSRSDLNGDGFTGGTPRAPLDLDPTSSPAAGPPKLDSEIEIEIEGVDVKFDERAVSDVDALCYWAYSELYEGSEDQRSNLLDPRRNCRAVANLDNGPLVVTGLSPRGAPPHPPNFQLWTVDPPAAPVVFTPKGEEPQGPAWSPDGTRIAYAASTRTPAGIWTIGSAGGSPTHVAGTGLGDLHPTWSPDGRRIAFQRMAGANSSGIFIIDAGGGTATLIPGTEEFAHPSWSPDGRKIAASTASFDGDEIAAFTPDGDDLEELTNDTTTDGEPDWSPDGSKIVFVSRRQIPGGTVVRKRLWIMDANGENPTQFTGPFATNTGGTTVEDHNPSWSPDGEEIAFSRSHQNGSRFVMVKDVSGADAAVQVTPGPTNNTDHTWDFPDWQPIPLP